MVASQLKTQARRIVEEIVNQDDLAVATELISPDCVHHVPAATASPGSPPCGTGWL